MSPSKQAPRAPSGKPRDWPGAGQWVPDDPTLPRLDEAIDACRGCNLYQDATQAVMGSGAADASLLVLGEQPGDKEDRAGEPFVGPAGRVLDRALADAGIDPDDIYVTNVVKHFRWEGRRGSQRLHKSPTRWQVAACGPWLVAELEVVRPTGVVLLGGTAGKAVYGSSFKVGTARGRLQDWPVATFAVRRPPAWVLPTTHPSAVLRTENRDDAYAGLVADLEVAAGALAP
ncbi:MAG TPA: UdgX family uracil-DNA binding protein [Marmoricola sp.]|nr:UdgX family uracil-DNA binding protein [Marmoricola sp.]